MHCGDCSGVSGTASDNQDKWITTRFELGDYLGTGNVKFQFIIGMYKYQAQGDGEHWYIDEIALSPSPERVIFKGNVTDDLVILTDSLELKYKRTFCISRNHNLCSFDFDRLRWQPYLSRPEMKTANGPKRFFGFNSRILK